MMLISLEYASDHLRRDTDADNADVTRKIEAASRAIVTYLGKDFFADSSGEIPEDSNGLAIGVLDDIQLACAICVAVYYDGDDQYSNVPSEFGYGYLPRQAIGLLFPYRQPASL